MDPINISLIVAAVVTLFLSFSIYFHSRGKDTKKFTLIFSLLALNIGLWSVSMVFFRYLPDAESSFLASRFLYAIPVFVPVLFLYFASIFTQLRVNDFYQKIAITISLFISLFFIGAVFVTDLIVSGVKVPAEGEKILFFGQLYIPYIIHYLFFFTAALSLLLKKYFSFRDQVKKNQVKNLFIGSLVASSITMVTNLLLPGFNYFELNWFGNLSTLVFVGFIFYAILQYKLFSLSIVAIEVFIVFILTLLGVDMLLFQSRTELTIKVMIFISVAGLSYFLIRSAYKAEENRKEIEGLARDLQKANTRLKELDQRKSEFLSLASHQLRTPLTAIKGYASMLAEGTFGKLTGQTLDAASRIFESSKRLVSVVDDFLTISRIEQDKLEYDFKPADFREVVQVIVNEMTLSAKTKGLKINFTTTGEMCCVIIDTGKVKQVLGNLIDNAIKYTPKGAIEVKLAQVTENNMIRFSVTDTGVGMSQDTIDLLFKKFSRADDASKVNTTGSGLGLYIAHRIVKEHGGRIWAESEGVGKGSTFLVEFPRSVRTEA